MVVFVSSIYEIYGKSEPNKIILENCVHLLKANINLIIFVDKIYYQALISMNVPKSKLVLFDLNLLPIYNLLKDPCDELGLLSPLKLRLPSHDTNVTKNSLGFLRIMNCKIDFIVEAYKLISDSHYIWIDFGIYKIFSNKSCEWLEKLSNTDLSKIDTVINPGCHRDIISFDNLCSRVYWNYLGGFFIVPNHRVEEFAQLSYNTLKKFVDNNIITWEVNIWIELENIYGPYFLWYLSNHNDLIYQGLFEKLKFTYTYM